MARINNDDLKKNIEEQFRAFEESFDSLVASNVDTDEKIREVDSLIEHISGRIGYTESRITRTVTFSIMLVGFGVAFFAVILKLSGVAFYLGIFTAAAFILTGGIAAYIHTKQINPKYPFREMKNDWKWFYPQIVSPAYKPRLFVGEKDQEYLSKRLQHAKDLGEFVVKMLKEDKEERLKVDLQQLFLLHVNEKYKNCFLSSLRTVLKKGLIVACTLFALLAISLIIDKDMSSDKAEPQKNQGGSTNIIYMPPLDRNQRW